MILPTTSSAALLLLIFSLVCLGSWANTKKLAGKWRFELFSLDFALGAVLCAVVAAFTLGSLNSQDLTFQDNLLIAGRRQMAYAFGGGMVFILANMFLLGAMQVSAMAVAFPVAFGMALAIGAAASFFLDTHVSAILLLMGGVFALIAVVVVAWAFGSYLEAQRPPEKALRPDPRAPKPGRGIPLGNTSRVSAAQGVTLALLSGILMSLSYPLIDSAMAGETAVTAYSAALLFSGGMLLGTLIYLPFFLNFPVQGNALGLPAYFKGAAAPHAWGILGGMVWMAGSVARFALAGAAPAVQPGSVVSFALWQGAALLMAFCGLLVWREFRGADGRVKSLLTCMIILLAAGIAAIALAPVYGK